MKLRALHEKQLFPLLERNVDTYLDWYYSLTGEYLRLANVATGNIENYMKEKMNETLIDPQVNRIRQDAEGVVKRFNEELAVIETKLALLTKLTDQALERAAEVSEEVAQVREKYNAQWEQEVKKILDICKVSIPEDLSAAKIAGYASMDEFMESLQPSQDVLPELTSFIERLKNYGEELQNLAKVFTSHSSGVISFKTRMGNASVAGIAGFGGGATIGARIASRVVRTQTFKIAVEAAGKMLAKRAGIG